MQLQFLFGPKETRLPADTLVVAGRRVPLELVRHDRARRYVLRLRPDGTARVTVPCRGSLRAAREFAEAHLDWIARQLARLSERPAKDRSWRAGTRISFRGELVELRVMETPHGPAVGFADQVVAVPADSLDFRPAVERHLRRLAAAELPPRVFAFAVQQQLTVRKVTIRDQRSRWGSCSRRGTVSLNWRLVQMPDAVRDYVVWHELMHLREMNHSPRFWRAVAAVCPDFAAARRWLRHHGESLR